MPNRLPVLLAAALTSLAARAQVVAPQRPDPRQFVTGKIVHADGSPWAGARVVLHSLAWETPPWPEFVDRVEAEANEQGLFRTRVLPGRSYIAFCTTAVQAGRYRRSNVQSVSAGAPVALAEDSTENIAVEIRLDGAGAWAARAPLSVEVFCMLDCRLDLPCEPLGQDRWRLPPVPRNSGFVRVRDRDGIDLASGVVPLTVAGRQKQLDGKAPDPNPDNLSRQRAPFVTDSLEVTTIRLPPPVPLDIAVQCNGKPVAGAVLTQADRADHRPWATSAADGTARLWLPANWSPKGEPLLRYVDFWLQGEGITTVHAYTPDLPIRNADGSPLPWLVEPPPGHVLKGRLSWRQGRPAARVPILVHTGVPGGSSFGGVGASMTGSPLCYWTDDNGRFTVPGRPGYLGFQLTVFLRERDLAELPASAAPCAPIQVLAAGDDAGGDQDLGELVLGDYVPIDVEVLDAQGKPVAGNRVQWRERLEATMQEKRVASALTDWQGRLRLYARPGVTLLVAPTDAEAREGEAVAAPRGGEPVQLQLRLRGR